LRSHVLAVKPALTTCALSKAGASKGLIVSVNGTEAITMSMLIFKPQVL